MGSGAFLVQTCRQLAEELVTAWELHDCQPSISADVKPRLHARRIVAQRCLYGVDLNPMAVELAKLSLWLHSFTLGAPLSFLDHHLRAGNSLIGFRDISEVIVPGSNAYGQYQTFMSYLNGINARADATLEEVQHDRQDFQAGQALIAPYRRRCDFRMAALGFVDMKGINVGAVEMRLQSGSGGYACGPMENDAGQTVMEHETPGEDAHALYAPVQASLFPSVAEGPPAPSRSGRTRSRRDAVAEKIAEARRAAAVHGFFHWELEFPEAFYDERGRKPDAGFDAVIGNPPWERMKLQEIEFFASRAPEVAAAPTAAHRRKLIADLARTNPELADKYKHVLLDTRRAMDYMRKSGVYPLLGHGDLNLYALFVERAMGLTAPRGRTGLVTPSGIASDAGSQTFFRTITEAGRLVDFIDFENKKHFFPEVDSRFKFAVSIFSGIEASPIETRCAFFIHRMEELADPERVFTLAPEDFALLNPNTRTCPVFRTRADAELTGEIYRRVPILVNENDEEGGNPWGIRFSTMFHMTNDSGLFRTAEQLDAAGFWHGTDHAWHKGRECYVRLYEGKMVQMFDHRAARIVVDPQNLFRPARPEPTFAAEKVDPNFTVNSRFYVPKSAVTKRLGEEPPWHLGFKEITAPTNERTFILAAFPPEGFGNKIPLLRFGGVSDRQRGYLLLANLSTYVFDFVCRQKIHGQTLNYYIVKQLPVLPPSAYEAPIQGRDVRPWIRDCVLELTYTASDMEGFARDLGYDGPPFVWDDARRLHLRCRLDALFFLLYGLTREQAGYVLDTFSSVRKNDLARFGCFRTRELILGYYNAVSAGDLDAGKSAQETGTEQ